MKIGDIIATAGGLVEVVQVSTGDQDEPVAFLVKQIIPMGNA